MPEKEIKKLFTPIEIRIIELYLNEKYSIREIEKQVQGYGRTKINNVLNRYAKTSEKADKQIKLRKYNSKNHRNSESLDNTEKVELSDEQIEEAHKLVMLEGESLRSLSKKYGLNRETIKKVILDYLDDDNDEKEFLDALELNRNRKTGTSKKSFLKLLDEEKKEVIFKKVNRITLNQGRKEYSKEFLEKGFERIFDYFYNERNQKIEDQKAKLSKDDIYLMMYDFPKMIVMSLNNKIKPTVNALEYEHLNQTNASIILRENPAVIGTALSRLNLQMKILKATGTLKHVLRKPRILRTSPELMYALIKRNEAENNENSSQTNPFMSRAKLLERHQTTPEQIMKKYNIRTEYGKDEYFDGR